jgi:hypothetical protein
MKKRQARILCAVLALSSTLSLPARAQTPPTVVSVADKTASDRADDLVKRGLALGHEDRYAEAEPLLREAWGLKQSYDIAANLGITEAALGHWAAAAEHLTYALKVFPTNGKPEHRKLGETTLASAMTHVATLTIKANVDRAEIVVDGESVGLSLLPKVLFLDPGPRVVGARLKGYEPAIQPFDARPGGSGELALELRQAIPLTSPGGAATPVSKPGPPIAMMVAGGALAVGGIVTGAVLTALANGKGSDAAALQSQLNSKTACAGTPVGQVALTCNSLGSTASSQAALANGAVAGFVVGGAFAVATGALWAWGGSGKHDTEAPGKSTSANLRVVPSVGAREGSILLLGRW